MNTGDTAWVLTSAVLVLGMTIPGLAFFYGGLVRRKNVLSILMQCFIIACVISLQWVLFGYSLAFGPDTGWGIIGSLKWAGLNFVGGQPNADYAATIPHQVFMIFQAMFAVITPALIIGAFAERMKFSAFLLFTVLWATLVYDPLAHCDWDWSDADDPLPAEIAEAGNEQVSADNANREPGERVLDGWNQRLDRIEESARRQAKDQLRRQARDFVAWLRQHPQSG